MILSKSPAEKRWGFGLLLYINHFDFIYRRWYVYVYYVRITQFAFNANEYRYYGFDRY